MYISVKEMELLKIICWCKSIPSPAGTIFGIKEISPLEYFGFISVNADSGNIRPRPKAYRLLTDAGMNYKSDLKPQTKIRVLSRRNIAAQILFTFHRAGISVFNSEIPQNITEPLYIASFAARQRDNNNPFGNTRFYGIFCTSQEAFIIFYVDEIGVFTHHELKLFHNFIQITGIRNTSIIMMGKSTSEITSTVVNAKKSEKTKKGFNTESFADIFGTTPLPIHFVPIGDAGAQILKFLQIPNYREATARAILKSKYAPPYEGLTDTDTIHHEKPYNPAVIALDMDVNRIDRAVASAKSAGHEKIAIYALKEQIPFLKSRYAQSGNADVLRIGLDTLTLDYDISLYTPPTAPYFSKEGRCFDVTDFSAYRKTGEPD